MILESSKIKYLYRGTGKRPVTLKLKKLFMRRILFPVLILLLFSGAAFSQTRLGFTAGASISNLYEKHGDDKVKSKYKIGLTAGIMLDVPMERNGSFQPALNFIQKGGKNETGEGSTLVTSDIRLNYVEMPLNVVFRIPCSAGKVVLGGGPAIALGLSGKSSVKDDTGEESSDIKFGSSSRDHDINFIDFALNATAGYEFNSGFFVAAAYTHGINNLLIDALEADKLYNRGFSLRIGFLLSGKEKAQK